MPSDPRYLFDSDVLITSSTKHYAYAYCEAFWDWLRAGHMADRFHSIDVVKREVLNGLNKGDPFYKWMTHPSMNPFFRNRGAVDDLVGKLTGMAQTSPKKFTHAAIEKFTNTAKADIWLIAYAAKHKGFVIVTNEESAPDSKKEIKLPDAANWLGVKTVKLVDVLNRYAIDNFTFRP
jgi:hypothetical protein